VKKRGSDIYGGADPRELPAYTYAEAAHYLQVPQSTLRAWSQGQKGKPYGFQQVLRLSPDQRQLSFFNLTEAFVLDALRRVHHVPLQRLRPAVDYLESLFPDTPHPLAQLELSVLERDVFVEDFGRLLNLTRPGQVAMRAVLERYLSRVDRDPSGPQRLYPFIRLQRDLDEPRLIVIDPRISFGRPVLAGTGIPTASIAERFKAGEPIEELADDYGRSAAEIQEAIRCELGLAA
jgi:uncharacterized protein (DUF433 family)